MSWDSRDWTVKKNCTTQVSILMSKFDVKHLVVRKVLKEQNYSVDARPIEIQLLDSLPANNRVIGPRLIMRSTPELNYTTAIFDHYPLGDLHAWRKEFFTEKSNKPVPKSYIWRMFVQMAQAVAFIHNEMGPAQSTRPVIIHRDIKDMNILVVENGTIYPSFRLIDFGYAIRQTPANAQTCSYGGTFEWQPPENPLINTTAADIWSLGACVYYMALGEKPIQNIAQYEAQQLASLGRQPLEAALYPNSQRYYAARVPRQVFAINLSEVQQIILEIPTTLRDGVRHYNYTYSDELNGWMRACLEFNVDRRVTSRRLISEMTVEAKEILWRMDGQPALTDIDLNTGS